MIRLYDTARREKVDFSPLSEGKVGFYVCGPTVYDMCHVGHARCYVSFDVAVRCLRQRGLAVNYVRNITDVDDKIINRAAELGEEPLGLSARFSEEFHRDMEALGCLPPDVEPRVSDHIPEIITLIEQIIASGNAYQAEGDVYFEVGGFAAYGGLSHRNLDELKAGARVEVDQRKRGPQDFALWKGAKPGEISWDSPWGKGRPGWHIECSAMSSRYLGETFDIHGGGMDLIFPHHENEVAQSKAANGLETFARYWMHNGFINVRTADSGEEKMSKSLGNFFTIRQVLALHEPEALRLFLLGTHYRSPISFEVEPQADGGVRFPNLEEAERRLGYAYTTISRLDQALAVGKPAPRPGEVLPAAGEFMQRFNEAMDDDFNAAAAMGHTSELLTLANKLLDQPGAASKKVRRRTLEDIRQALDAVHATLGIFGQDPEAFLARRRTSLCVARGIKPEEVEASINARNEARKAKDFARADELRDELAARGVELMDGPTGTAWRVAEDQHIS